MPTGSNTMKLALVAGGAFAGGYSNILGSIVPGGMQVPAGCLAGGTAGSAINALVSDTAIDYKGSFMVGLWAFGGSLAAGFVGGSFGSPMIVQSAGGAIGALIGSGLGGITSYL